MEKEAILTFDKVTLAPQPPYEVGLAGVSFSLGSGELMAVRVEAGQARIPLADAAEGLVEPGSGRVTFLGEDWLAMPPVRASTQRGRIGRVFERYGWISNLDVDENITLAQRHHTTRPLPEIEEEAERLVKMFGLPDLPRMRPALMKRADLRRAEWARAFLGGPVLVILEEPTRDVYADAVASLARAVEEARARGAAVMLISSDAQAWPTAAAGATHRFEFKGGRLLPREKE
ncbi:MAG: ATP-binding cassette domain-containing protein [Verrucomicrobiota bacterium]